MIRVHFIESRFAEDFAGLCTTSVARISPTTFEGYGGVISHKLSQAPMQEGIHYEIERIEITDPKLIALLQKIGSALG